MDATDKRTLIFRKVLDRKIGEQHGMTLVEVMTVLVVIALLALFAAPDLISWQPRMNLKRASDELFTGMQLAKVHAIKNNVDVYLAVRDDAACTGGGGQYVFAEVGSGNIIAEGTMANGVCISASTFPIPTAIPVPAGEVATMEGFSARGFTIKNTGGKVTVKNTKLPGKQFEVIQSVAGGVSLD